MESVSKILQDSSLRIFTSPDWGSHNKNHRELIHAEVAKIKAASVDLHISISHCQGVGVIACSKHPIGVDVEVTARVLEKVVARVSSAEELQASPSPASLWCAKEACFKALRSFDQPSVVSPISIGDWKNIDSQTETYHLTNSQSFKSPSENEGIVIHSELHTYSFFIFRA